MAWCALGDSAWLFESLGDTPTRRLAGVLELLKHLQASRIPEVTDIVSSFDTVAVHFDPLDGEIVLDWLATVPLPPLGFDQLPEGRHIDIPTVYGGEFGPDLENLAMELGRSTEDIIELHSTAEYTVACVGFSPGFPYLIGLPGELHVPRRATPRPVAAGSVAIASNQAGIYPCDSQGGWHVLGRTALSMFDPASPEPSRLRAGDRVRFIPANRLESSTPSAASHSEALHGGIEILEPGAITTVQDLGRPGYQSLGVTPGGAADVLAAVAANRLVGNPDEAAVLECCMTGPVLKLHQAARIAWVGWQNNSSGRPVEFEVGEEIHLRGPLRGVRGYVAFAGGINVPLLMNSRSTDVRGGFGGYFGRPLQTGDRLTLGTPGEGPVPGNWRIHWPYEVQPREVLELRFLPGMQAGAFDKIAWHHFRNGIFRVSAMSDRTGARLEGPALAPSHAGTMVSQPVVEGSIQVPPDGAPIILLAERQTIGGYPQIAHVISADLPKLARAWPGTALRFREVSLNEARDAWLDIQLELEHLQTGLDFLR